MNKKTLSQWVLILLAILVPVMMAGKEWYSKSYFSCSSQITLVSEQAIWENMMHFSIKGRHGDFQSQGLFQILTGAKVQTSNQVNFDIFREDDRYVFVANETNKKPRQILPFMPYIPDFYHSRHHGMRLRIVPVNASGYLFFRDNAPAYYCARSDKSST